jgi:aminopeptidase N
MRRLVVALALMVGVPAGLVSAAPHGGGLSSPVEDSYYPAKGEPSVDALRCTLRLHWAPGNRMLHGQAVIRIRAARRAAALTLDLAHRLEVIRVHVDGGRTVFAHDANHPVVRTPLRRGQRHRVRVDYRGTPGPVPAPGTRGDAHLVGLRIMGKNQLRTMQEPFGAFTWYPVNDQPSDKALYDVCISAPPKWVGVSNGRLVARRTTRRSTVTRWIHSAPMASYLTTLAVGPYRRHRDVGPHSLPVTYWVPRSRPRLVTSLRMVPAALRWLERRLGRFPFDRVGIVIVPGPSAMETQTMVTLGAREYRAGPARVRQVIVHELAHQWYGDSVTPTDWRDLWMNEGMATYLHYRWVAAQADHPTRRWRQITGQWRRDDQFYRDAYGPPGAYMRQEFGSSNVYYPVALMWDRLRLRLGNTQFNDIVRAWPQTHRNGNATRAQMIRWIENRTHQELSAFFDKWLMSRRSPA